MIINDVNGKPAVSGFKIASPSEAQPSQNDRVGFMNYLKSAIGQVDALQKEAAVNAEKLALGDESYLHNTIISYEKATLALQLMIEVRNRMVEAYQDIMRMQM